MLALPRLGSVLEFGCHMEPRSCLLASPSAVGTLLPLEPLFLKENMGFPTPQYLALLSLRRLAGQKIFSAGLLRTTEGSSVTVY